MPPCASSTALPNELRAVRVQVVVGRGQLEQAARRVHRVLSRSPTPPDSLRHDEAQAVLPGLPARLPAPWPAAGRRRTVREPRTPPFRTGPDRARRAAPASLRSGRPARPGRRLARGVRPPPRRRPAHGGTPGRHAAARHAPSDHRDGRPPQEKRPVRGAPRPPSGDHSSAMLTVRLPERCARQDSNLQPSGYEPPALTS